MRREGSSSNLSGAMMFASPNSKNSRGLKALLHPTCPPDPNNFGDDELALRKAEEAAARRNQAAEWLRQMDKVAWESLPKEPTEEDFCLALRNGLILCNVLNKVNPGAVPKVVDNSVLTVQSIEGAAQSAIQYFENMRNFLVAVGNMKLLTFEASDLEKGGSSGKVVDCILCLKGYYEWKQSGGVGVWRYGGTVKIVSYPKDSSTSTSTGSESADESLDEYESSQYEQLSEFLHLSDKVSTEESRAATALCLLFDQFGIGILKVYLTEKNDTEDFPLNSMVIDTVIRKVVKDFSTVLVSQGIQLGLLMKKLLKSETPQLSKDDFLDAISQYLIKQTGLGSSDSSQFCICGGILRQNNKPVIAYSGDHKEVIESQQKQIEALHAPRLIVPKELKTSFHETKQEVRRIQSDWEKEVAALGYHINNLEVASSSYHKVLEENRHLYNQVQDLKGTIRVYCRVRPFLPGQLDKSTTVDHIGENGNIMIVHPHRQGRDARKIFSFNKVFGTNVTQQQIYADTEPLVRSVLDGFNVCIFAYGQTGSGKTYTMSGPDLTSEDTWGVNYRALNDLFEISKARADVIEYGIGVQMIEIYNEQVRDLLVVDGSTRRLDIRNNSQLNGLNVPDASLVSVSCTQDVLELMRIGQRNRAVGATALNERSSRSHSILTVHVHGKELLTGTLLRGCLHLVDLAGSERVDKSEAVGERLREAQHINKSLSALGDVISALAQKSSHIPYRNSKLTQVLQDSLGGQAKTLMFVHINPESDAIGETISTLKFAERVASIELGAAKSNKETTEIRDLKDEVTNLKQALEKKEAEFEVMQKNTNIRSASEAQKPRTISPMHVPRFGNSPSLKPESVRSTEDRNSETRSCSSGKQRRSRLPSICSDKEMMIPKMPLIAEETIRRSMKPRSPSPPVRRSISTDRGALTRSRIKPEMAEDPVRKLQFPARVSVNRSMATTIPAISSTDNHSEVIHNLQSPDIKRVQPEHEDEQLKRVLSVRQGVIKKTKAKPKPSNKMEEAQKSDFSETENELDPGSTPMLHNSRLKRSRIHSSKTSQNLEPPSSRGPLQTVETVLGAGRVESRARNIKGSNNNNNTSMPELRRSRSTPRGKFFILP